MIQYDGKRWLPILLSLKSSVLPGLWPRVLLSAGIGGVAQLCFQLFAFKIPPLGHTLLGAALGLLLVFRTNASYDRFWEGRRALGMITNRSRDLMRQTKSLLAGTDAQSRRAAEDVQRLLVLFYRLTAQTLRDERDLSALGSLLSDEERARLEPATARAGVVATWLSARLVAEAERTSTAEQRLAAMDANLTALLDSLGVCERIRRTPVPFAYAQHIKLFVTLWCFSVPFALVDSMRLCTPLAAALLSFALFGIDEIGVEIEDPFGYDPNDLAMDAIGDGIDQSTRDILDG